MSADKETGPSELLRGAIAILPAALAVIPFALLLGALAGQKGLSVLEVMMMSGLVFAGASQFIAVDLWKEPAPWILLTVTALMVNSRHLLMGASLAPRISHFGSARSALSLFFLADEVWAIAEVHARRRRLSLPFMLGAGGLLWVNWVAWTGLGAAIGMVVRNPAAFGFDFAFTAIFVGLLASLWQGSRTGVAIAASAVAATAVHLAFDGPWYIAAGGLVGATVGALAWRPAKAAPDRPGRSST